MTLFLPAGRGRWFESRPPSQLSPPPLVRVQASQPTFTVSQQIASQDLHAPTKISSHESPEVFQQYNVNYRRDVSEAMEKLAECSRTLDLDFIPARLPRALARVQASQPTSTTSQPSPPQGLQALAMISCYEPTKVFRQRNSKDQRYFNEAMNS